MAALAAAAWVFSPGFIAGHFSPDGQLGGYVASRIQALRFCAVLGAAVLAVFGLIPGATARVAGILRAESKRPFWVRAAFAAMFVFLWNELRIVESEPCSEGYFTYGAWRASLGEVTCRDYFSYVLPGWHYYLGLFYKVFGPSVDIARIVGSVLPKFLSAIVFFFVARLRLEPLPSAAVSFLCLLFWSANPSNAQAHNGYLAILLASATLPLMARFARGIDAQATPYRVVASRLPSRGGGRRTLAAAGLLAGSCAVVRQDFGLYALATNLSFLALVLAVSGERRPGRWARVLAAYAGPWAVIAGGMAAAMAVAVPFEQLYECFVSGPMNYMAHHSSRGRNLVPFLNTFLESGGLSWGQIASRAVLFESSLLLALVALAMGAWRWARQAREARPLENSGALILVLLWTGFFMGHVFKGGGNDFAGAGPGSLVLLAYLLSDLSAAPRGSGRARMFLTGVACLSGWSGVRLFFRPLAPPAESVMTQTPVGPYLCRSAAAAENLERALAHVRSAVPEGEPILVHNSLMYCNDVLFYFLSQRAAGTRYIEYLPGLESSPQVQSRMISDITGRGVRRIVENLAMSDGRSAADKSSGDLLDTFIRTHFRPEARFGTYVIWAREGL